LNRAAPNHELLATLARLKLLDEKPADAAALCELGHKAFPASSDFVQGLAAAYAQLDDAPRLAAALDELCQLVPDDPLPRKRLTELALKQKHYADAIRFAKSALYVDVLDADIHRQLGEAWLGASDAKKAVAELEAAADLKPKDSDVELALSKALIAAGRKADARPRLEAILERDPKQTDARALLDSIK